eukprot:m.8546 g.8546  ORF g.8546 m.8546 type:complete len:184 (-) comp5472_c0_seq1:1221-1772(-)
MEFSPQVEAELRVASDISDATFTTILDLARLSLTDPTHDAAGTTLDRAGKQAHAGLLTLLAEACKQQASEDALTSLMEDIGFADGRRNLVLQTFKEIVTPTRAQLRKIASELPHVVDVKWRLDYNTKGKNLEAIHEPIYTVILQTENGSERGTIEMTCTMAQLQDLVSTLKDACKSVQDLQQV